MRERGGGSEGGWVPKTGVGGGLIWGTGRGINTSHNDIHLKMRGKNTKAWLIEEGC